MTPGEPIPADALEALASLVEGLSGLRFVQGRQSELATKLARAFAESGCETWPAFQDQLTNSSDSAALQRLIEQLTVGETYFYRHRAYFDLLERELLPEVASRRQATRQLRVWCAGCATGEEAYSLAIAIRRALPDIDDWQVMIQATDLNRTFLARAEAGVYSEWSFRETDAAFKEAYFTAAERGRYRIRPEFRDMVRFAQLNLAEDGYPSMGNGTAALDLVLCRNVLLYFRPELSQQIVGRLHTALLPGGWLVLGPSDARPGLLADFDMHARQGTVVYRKRPTSQSLLAPPPAPRLWAPAPQIELPPTPVGLHAQDAPAVGEVLETDWRVAWLAARSLADSGELDDAETHCQLAIGQAPLRPEPHYLFGALRQARGDDGASLVAFRKALYVDPTFVPALLAQAAIHRRGGAADRAQQALTRAQRLLEARKPDELVLAEDGLTVGRLRDAVEQALAETC